MNEQQHREEAARLDRQQAEQHAAEGRQLEERQRQEQEPVREERLKEETRRKEENSQRKDDKTPQSQELRDLANIEDKYMRLAKSGYYDEKRAEAKEQTKEAPAQGGFATRREALKPKVQEALKKQEQSKTHDMGRGR